MKRVIKAPDDNYCKTYHQWLPKSNSLKCLFRLCVQKKIIIKQKTYGLSIKSRRESSGLVSLDEQNKRRMSLKTRS